MRGTAASCHTSGDQAVLILQFGNHGHTTVARTYLADGLVTTATGL